jgi:hypothetical protein
MTHQTPLYITIEADTDNFQDIARELRESIAEAGNVYIPVPKYDKNRRASEFLSTDIIVALSSAGVFTGIFKLLASYLHRNLTREIKIQRGHTKVTIKGHALPEEQALTATLFPELARSQPPQGRVT